jgi:UPF0716 protein FxsA
MPLLLILLFIVVPIAELYVIIQVGELIGLWPTLALLLLDAVLGSLLLKHQGRSAWRRFNAALAERRFPGREVVDGVLIVVGGTLLVSPGFISDIVGIFLLLPPTRAIARRILRRFTIGRITVMGVGFPGSGGFGGGGSGGFRGFGSRGGGEGRDGSAGPIRDYDYDVEAEEVPTTGNGAGQRLPRADEES